MGLLLDAAKAWSELQNIQYIFDVAKKGKATRIELAFINEDFPHLAGMQYARDVDFGIRKSEYYGKLLVSAILHGTLVETKIEKSRNWKRISGRLKAIVELQHTLDGEFRIVKFQKAKVHGFSQIEAKFLIQNTASEAIYFIFLDESSGRYYCKSVFQKESVNYMENQSPMTILQKQKVVDGKAEVLYQKSGYMTDSRL